MFSTGHNYGGAPISQTMNTIMEEQQANRGRPTNYNGQATRTTASSAAPGAGFVDDPVAPSVLREMIGDAMAAAAGPQAAPVALGRSLNISPVAAGAGFSAGGGMRPQIGGGRRAFGGMQELRRAFGGRPQQYGPDPYAIPTYPGRDHLRGPGLATMYQPSRLQWLLHPNMKDWLTMGPAGNYGRPDRGGFYS